MFDLFWRHPTLISFSLIAFLYSGYCPLNHGGFYCNDDSIASKRASAEYFPLKPLLFICVVPPMVLVIMKEMRWGVYSISNLIFYNFSSCWASCWVCPNFSPSPLRKSGTQPTRRAASGCLGGPRGTFTVTTGRPASSTSLSTNCSRQWWRSRGRTFWTLASQTGRQSTAH